MPGPAQARKISFASLWSNYPKRGQPKLVLGSWEVERRLVLVDPMKRAALIVAVVFALVAAVLVLGPRVLRDPELSNPYDSNATPVEFAPPKFFASEPSLLEVGPFVISENIVEEGTDAGMEGAPYLIEFADGRFVFGYTGATGRTRSVYTSTITPHRTYWYDEALERWISLRGGLVHKTDAVQRGVAADGASPSR